MCHQWAGTLEDIPKKKKHISTYNLIFLIYNVIKNIINTYNTSMKFICKVLCCIGIAWLNITVVICNG